MTGLFIVNRDQTLAVQGVVRLRFERCRNEIGRRRCLRCWFHVGEGCGKKGLPKLCWCSREDKCQGIWKEAE